MSLRPIHLLGSPVLRERASEIAVVDAEVRELIADLYEVMRAAKGVGLAANQVGVARRVAVVETGEGESFALVNPVIVATEGKVKGEEGCLSIPDIYADIERGARVVVEAADEYGRRRRVEGTGLLARAIQHEIDHLDGILFLDRVGPLKRRMLLRDWEKQRRGKVGHLRELAPEKDPAGA
ncbi:MAG TPA: peptide deformylase [Gemmatimonadales bacterium]|nr:peptide deformylase [Gemmatimonadales bacterium]